MSDEYAKTLNYLNSLYSYERDATRQSPPEFHLDSITELLAKIGNPHKSYKMIHIAGTKGKGSTAIFLSNILRRAGFKVGTYMSPHIIDVRERICINCEQVSESDLTRAVNVIKDVIGPRPKEFATFFEVLTAAAFWLFDDLGVDFAVVETGLGGKYDATNVVKSDIAIITKIGLDHTERLGNTKVKIAVDKSHIIKRNSIVISASQEDDVIAVVRDFSKKADAQLFVYGSDFNAEIIGSSLRGTRFRLRYNDEWLDIDLSVAGRFQVENASLAAFAALKLGIKPEFIRAGLFDSLTPARFQLISYSPVIVLDSAHNEPSAKSLAVELANYNLTPAIMVVGINRPKDYKSMISAWIPVSSQIVFTGTSSLREYEPRLLADFTKESGFDKVFVVDNPFEAFLHSKSLSGDDKPVVVAGSMYLVGEILKGIGIKSVKLHR